MWSGQACKLHLLFVLGTVRLYFSFNFQNYPQKTYKDEEAEAEREVIWPRAQASQWHGGI